MSQPRTSASRRRKVVVAALLGIAALALSGCWGTYTFVGKDGKNRDTHLVTVHQQPTDDWIHDCDNNPGTIAEANCVLDQIRSACSTTPIGWPDCNVATEHWYVTCFRVGPPDWPGGPDVHEPENCAESMKRAITGIRSEQGQCLTYEAYVGDDSNGWYAGGNRGC